MFNPKLLRPKRFIFRGPPESMDFDQMLYSLEGVKAEKLVEVLLIELEKAGEDGLDDLFKRYQEQWYKDFLKAGFDIRQNKKLPHYNAEKVREMDELLDKMLRVISTIREEKSSRHENLKGNISKFNEKTEVALRRAFERKVETGKPPIYAVELNNPLRSTLKIRSLKDFDPAGEPGSKIDLREAKLAGALNGPVKYNLRSTMFLDKHSTPVNEGIKKIADFFIKEYFVENPQILAKFGIKNIRKVTPRQAVQLASYIPIERLKYSRAQAKRKSREERIESDLNDLVPIDKLLRWEKTADGNGVCRNYAEVAAAALEAIKMLQDTKTSLIHNTHAVILHDDPRHPVPGSVYNHAWNAFVNIGPNGIDAIVTDSTWGDEDSVDADPARQGQKEVRLDFSERRMFTLIKNFEKVGLISPVEHARILIQEYGKKQSYEFPQITRKNFSWEIASFPQEHNVGTRLLEVLAGLQPLPEDPKRVLPEIMEKYMSHLEKAERQMTAARLRFRSNSINKHMLSRFLRASLSVLRILNKNMLPKRLNNSLKKRLSSSVKRLHATIPPVLLKDIALFFEVSDQLGLKSVMDKLPQSAWAIKDPYGDLKDWLDLQKAPSHKRSRIKRERFGSKEKLEIKNSFGFRRINDGAVSKWKRGEERRFYKSLKEALLSVNTNNYDIGKLNMRVEEGLENKFSIGTILLGPNMKAKEIKEKIEECIKFELAWQKVLKVTVSTVLARIKPITKEDLRKFLTNTFRFFSSNPEHEFKYTQIVITNPHTHYHSAISLNFELFLKGNYEKVKERIEKAKAFKASLHIRKIDSANLSKHFHEIAQKYPEINGITLDLDNKEHFAKTKKLYEKFKKDLPNIIAKNPELRSYPIGIEVVQRVSGLNNMLGANGIITIYANKPPEENLRFFKENLAQHVAWQKRLASLKWRFNIKLSGNNNSILSPGVFKTMDALKILLTRNPKILSGRTAKIEECGEKIVKLRIQPSGTKRHYHVAINPKGKNEAALLEKLSQTINSLEKSIAQIEKRYGVTVSFSFSKFFDLDSLNELGAKTKMAKSSLRFIRAHLNKNPRAYKGHEIRIYNSAPPLEIKEYYQHKFMVLQKKYPPRKP